MDQIFKPETVKANNQSSISSTSAPTRLVATAVGTTLAPPNSRRFNGASFSFFAFSISFPSLVHTSHDSHLEEVGWMPSKWARRNSWRQREVDSQYSTSFGGGGVSNYQ